MLKSYQKLKELNYKSQHADMLEGCKMGRVCFSNQELGLTKNNIRKDQEEKNSGIDAYRLALNDVSNGLKILQE